MKSITIHNLEEDLYTLIRNEAKKNMRSMNQEIKDKLVKVFIGDKEEKQEVSFQKYLGFWNDEDYSQFKEKTEDFEKIYESDWVS
ncbi:MAG: hypothetical protein V1779_04590 [bacterium]